MTAIKDVFSEGHEAALLQLVMGNNVPFDNRAAWVPLPVILKRIYGDEQAAEHILTQAIGDLKSKETEVFYEKGAFAYADFTLEHHESNYKLPTSQILVSPLGVAFLKDLFSYVKR